LVGLLALSPRDSFNPAIFPLHETNRHTPLEAHIGISKKGRLPKIIPERKMAAQYTTDIPFSSSHHQQAFKLLELPPELLALLESDNPPMYTHPSSAGSSS
jgi:hypothetical protein